MILIFEADKTMHYLVVLVVVHDINSTISTSGDFT